MLQKVSRSRSILPADKMALGEEDSDELVKWSTDAPDAAASHPAPAVPAWRVLILILSPSL
jgi:hypothetical protein